MSQKSFAILCFIVFIVGHSSGSNATYYDYKKKPEESNLLPSNIIGLWQTQKAEKNAQIDIDRCLDDKTQLCGKITWLQEPNYADGSQKRDKNNPDPTQRLRPLIGMNLIQDFAIDPNDPNKCSDGTIYNPENGKTYTCSMDLIQPNTLEVRGYVGLPIFGETQTWIRVTKTS